MFANLQYRGLKMKKKLIMLLAMVTAVVLTGCAQPTSAPQAESGTDDGQKKSIVTTTFSEYDWVREILGEDAQNFELTLLIDNGVDLHSFEPSVEDITKVTSSDLFIYNGGESASWIDELLAISENSHVNSVEIMELLGTAVKAEVQVEGMQVDEHSHDHGDETEHVHDEETEHAHEEETEHVHEEETEHVHEEETEHVHEEETEHVGYDDEHVWLSLKNAVVACELLTEEIVKLNPENEEAYRTNASAYIAELNELDEQYEQAVESAERDTLVFADRFPFLYMMTDYGINYYAAFQGCSAQTEASFETVAFLTEKTNELELSNILIIDNGMQDLATTVVQSSEMKDCNILTLDSMQAVSQELISQGETYLKVMQENLEILKTALSQ